MPAAGVMSRHGGPPYSRRLAAALSRLDALIDWERSVRAAGAHRRMRVSSAPCGDLLARLGSPQSRLPVAVHITGSKGKGSVAALTAAALSAAGYRTGVYGSPHVASVTERVRIDGVPVGEDALAVALEAALDARAAAIADRGGGGWGRAPVGRRGTGAAPQMRPTARLLTAVRRQRLCPMAGVPLTPLSTRRRTLPGLTS